MTVVFRKSIDRCPRQLASYFRVLLASAVLTFTSGSHAEDIDIYTGIFADDAAPGTSPPELNPNIMFILDDSGSMNSFVLLPALGLVGAEYDSTVDYGEDGDAADDEYIYIYDSDLDYQGRFVTDAQNKCQALRDRIADQPDNPVFLNKAIQWRPNGNNKWRWERSFGTSTNSNQVLECLADRSVHALTATNISWPRNCKNRCGNPTPRYRNIAPENNRNPYKNASNSNLVTGNYHDYLVVRAAIIASGFSGDSVSDCTAEDQILVDDGEIVGQCNRKLTVMKRAMNNALDSFTDVNVGLMDFNTNYSSGSGSQHGGTVIRASGDINDAVFLTSFKSALESMRAGGNTPLTESLFEAYNVFAGNRRYYGETRDDNNQHVANVSPIRYKSPIVNECQSNNIVLLSDGEPTADQHADAAINRLLRAGQSCSFGTGYFSGTDTCLDDLAGYMANNDISTGAGGVRGKNSVFTYTIGFNIDNAELQQAADAGRPPGSQAGSGYFQANDILALETAFRRIIVQIQSVEADTFVAPAVTVNAYNRLQNREDIYYVVFKPNTNARWNGNLKKYKVTANGEIEDQNGKNAISETTGFFKDEAQSFWSELADGADVVSGGVAEHLSTTRDLYGNLNSATTVVTKLTKDGNPNASVNEFLRQVVVNNNIDIGEVPNAFGDSAVDLLDADRQENLLKVAAWTLGRDIDDEDGGGSDQPTNFVGDNIHGQPYVLSFGTSAVDPQDIIFFTSNQGMLHAVTGDLRAGIPGGTEAWAYVPDPSLFKNFGDYYNREAEKVYGLDGEMAFSVQRNKLTNAVTKAILYFGQRRGGRKVFAVDVTKATEANNPVSKLWTLDGGVGDFIQMGQSWAEPVTAKIRYCANSGSTDCPLKDVIVLSGGYDTAYDDKDVTVASLSGTVVGNAVYIVDASNGNLLWMAGSDVINASRDLVIPEMTHSIPSKPTVLDVTKDGAVDMMFFTDLSGQVFRIDFKAGSGDDNSIFGVNNDGKVAGGLIADLSQTGADRRFYNPIDAVLLPPVEGGAAARYALVTGSGYRANPLEAESFGNRLFVLFDDNIFEPAYDEAFDADLDSDIEDDAYYLYAEDSIGDPAIISMDETSQQLGLIDSATTLDTGGEHQYGFYTEFSGTGEKIITPTLISDFRVIAVSYLPDDGTSSTEVCSSGVGASNAYEFNLLTGELNKTELVKPGLTAEPVVVYVVSQDPVTNEESLKPIVIIGTEPFEGEDFGLTNLKLGKAEKKAWWEQGRAN